MTVIFLSVVVAWVSLILFYAWKGHYAAALFNAVIGLYEFPALLIHNFGIDLGLSAYTGLFLPVVDDVGARRFVIFVTMFFFICNSSYFVFDRTLPFRRGTDRNWLDADPVRYAPYFALFIGLLGVISLGTMSGEFRRSDYEMTDLLLESSGANPAHFYGRTILVSVVGLGFLMFTEGRRWTSFIVLLAIIPLFYDLFLSGRRQSFAPAAVLLLLMTMYGRKFRYRRLIAGILAVSFLIFSSFQFRARSEAFSETYGLEGSGLIVNPVMGELVAVGATSLASFRYIGENDFSHGFHILVSVMNSVPFLRLGNRLAGDLGVRLWSDHELVAPYGGFSMLADAFLAFGEAGYVLAGIAMSLVLVLIHRAFVRNANSVGGSSIGGLLSMSAGAMFLIGYRNGICDSTRAVITLAILFLFVVFVGDLLPLLARRDAIRSGRTG